MLKSGPIHREQSEMRTMGLVIRPGVEAAEKVANEVLAWAKARSLGVRIEQHSAVALKSKEKGISAKELVSACDPIVALGGDGTLIGVGRYVGAHSPVLLGVNFGRLGFLTEVAPHELFETLERVLKGEASIGERDLILCEVFRDGKRVFESQAVNDAVVHKGALDGLMDLDIAIGKELVLRLRADGVIVSTPTGSTAYSLACGGPIVHPALSVMIVTPISPHILTVRPFIVSQDSRLSVCLPPYNGQAFLSIDGQVGFELKVGDSIEVARSLHKVKFVHSPSKKYFEILRRKFSWGVGTHDEA